MLKRVRKRQYVGILHLLLLLNIFRMCVSIKGNNYAVLRGSTIRIGCVTKNVQVEGESDVSSSYSWTDQDNKEVIDARFTKLASGELEIANAHIADSGSYTCTFRPPSTWDQKNLMEKAFHHKLIVYEIAGHAFISSAFFDLSTYTAEGTVSVLQELLKSRACGNDLCIPATVKSTKCALLENGKQTCEFELPYKSLEPLTDEQCDEECVNSVMIERLKKAEKSLKAALMAELENPRALLKPDMKSFNTKHLTTCRAGFRLVKTHHKRCFPCFPGTYSKQNSLKCHMCAVGFYQEYYGKHQCEKCEKGKTTENVGAKTREECVPSVLDLGLTNLTSLSNKEFILDAGILTDIKEGIKSIFTG